MTSEDSTTSTTEEPKEDLQERKTSAETDTSEPKKEEFTSNKWKPAIEKKASDTSKESNNEQSNQVLTVKNDFNSQ